MDYQVKIPNLLLEKKIYYHILPKLHKHTIQKVLKIHFMT